MKKGETGYVSEKTKIQMFMVLGLDCLCIIASLILANDIRNGRLFDSDNARMNLGLMMGACLTVFLGMNLLRSSDRDIREMKDYSYELTGIVLLDGADASGEVEGIKAVAMPDDLIDYCRGASLDEVIVAAEDWERERILEKMEILALMGITVHAGIAVPELKHAGQKALSRFGHSYVITYANRVAPAGQIFLKRLLDVCGAAVGCVFLLLLTVILGPVIKLESPGPVFFAQKRVGRNGRIFKMYKFRSMYADAEEQKKELMEKNEMNGLMFKMENDPRITRAGRFMRRTSLDEFPQFINILKGDMSLVGTRPPTLDEFAQYSPIIRNG